MEKRAVLGFSYGSGTSNLALIRKFWDYNFWDLPDLDFILQRELSDAYQKQELFNANIVYVIREHQNPEQYLDSDEVARQGVEFAAKAGYKEILVLAKPIPHLVLCYFLTRKLAKPHGIKVKIAWVGFIPNDPLSEQRHARSFIGPYLYTIKRVLLGKKGF